MLHHQCSPPLLHLLLVAAVAKGVLPDMVCDPSSAGGHDARARLRRLRGDLLCEYDTLTPPQPVVNISVELFVRRAKMVSRTLDMQVLLNVANHFLQWDPAKHDDVKEIQLSSDEIWTPAVDTITTLFWSREDADSRGVWPATCSVACNGSVACTTALDMGGICDVSHLYWPHVEASCATFLGNDFHIDKNVSFHFHSDSEQAELANYVPDNDWVVADVQRREFATDSGVVTMLIYQLKLHARGAVVLTALMGPAVVLSLLILVSFFIPANSYARFALCCCSTFGTILASSMLFETLPPYDGPNPVIVTFYSGLMVLSAIATLVPLLLNTMVSGKRKGLVAPRWLYTFHSWLTNSMIGKIWLHCLFMVPQQKGDFPPTVEEQTEENHDELPHREDTADHCHHLGPHRIWDFIASFLDRTMFYMFIVLCSTLCLYLVHNVTIYKDVDIGWIH